MSDGTRPAGREFATLLVVAAVCLLAFAALVPTLGEGRPANEIPVTELSGDEAPMDPTDETWTRVPESDVAMASAGAAVPNAEDVTVEETSVEAATDGDRLYLRLSWPDATADEASDAPETHADAIAVQLPTNGTDQPPIAMGGADNTVNVWYWSADLGSEELLAGGAGTTTGLNESFLESNATRDGDRWRVTFVRDLETGGEARAEIDDERDVDVAVAAWNGSNAERAGQKSISEWHYVAFGPGPAGPPYETILWTIAGLAVAGVIAVTILGVRRT